MYRRATYGIYIVYLPPLIMATGGIKGKTKSLGTDVKGTCEGHDN